MFKVLFHDGQLQVNRSRKSRTLKGAASVFGYCRMIFMQSRAYSSVFAGACS